MKILWFTWKDGTHPLAGGAELVNEELAQRLVRDGHEVVFVVGGYDDCIEKENMSDGYTVVRLGNRYTVYWQAYRYYKKNLQGWADTVIDEVNTMPFFTQFYVKESHILFFHQLSRDVWFHQMAFPLSVVGYLLEPVYLWILRKSAIITISQSTKNDLLRYGFADNKIEIIPQGMNVVAAEDITTIKKYKTPTVLSLGALRKMKGTADQVRAFEVAKERMPELKMIIAGNVGDAYGQEVLAMIARSPYKDDIAYLGRVSEEKKKEIMQKSHAILVASVKEGWGLIVSEAASQGTPAIVYDVDGLRDSTLHGKGGIITKENTPKAMAEAIRTFLGNQDEYSTIQRTAWEFAREMNFEKSYQRFIELLTQ